MQPAPPVPLHTLRHHPAPLSALAFSPGNTHLYSGDQAGTVSITDLRLRRTVRTWHAHEGGVLSLEEWAGRLLTHGRDNKLHTFLLPPSNAPRLVGREANTAPLELVQTLPTNSLNFCRFSLLPLPSALSAPAFASSPGLPPGGKGKARAGTEAEALLALPNLGDSELVDVYHLPSLERLHAGVNWAPRGPRPADGGKQEGRTGLVMGIHLGLLPPPVATSGERGRRLGCALGYEDGRIEVWISPEPNAGQDEGLSWREKSDPRVGIGKGWKKAWEAKGHNEAIMALTVDRQFRQAFTVSADHLLVRYDLAAAMPFLSSISTQDPAVSSQEADTSLQDGALDSVRKYPLKQIGNGSVAISVTGQVVAVGGWDGRVRLFSASTCKPLGTLVAHRESVHCLAFAHPAIRSLALSAGTFVRPSAGLDGPTTSSTAGSDADADADVEASTIDLDGASLHSDNNERDDDEEDEELDGAVPRSRWLASGGKDRRVYLWGLMDFARGA